MGGLTLWTIGHSVRPADELVEMLKRARIGRLVDVRRFPASRRHPQFNREALEQRLADEGIGYRWAGEALGGRRKPHPGSPNGGLRNASFRAYADYMASAEFKAGASELIDEARGTRLAIMCAEHHPSRCHRRLIADWLSVHGVEVTHLIEPDRTEAHHMTPGGVPSEGGVAYPGNDAQLPLLDTSPGGKPKRSGSRGSR